MQDIHHVLWAPGVDSCTADWGGLKSAPEEDQEEDRI